MQSISHTIHAAPVAPPPRASQSATALPVKHYPGPSLMREVLGPPKVQFMKLVPQEKNRVVFRHANQDVPVSTHSAGKLDRKVMNKKASEFYSTLDQLKSEAVLSKTDGEIHYRNLRLKAMIDLKRLNVPEPMHSLLSMAAGQVLLSPEMECELISKDEPNATIRSWLIERLTASVGRRVNGYITNDAPTAIPIAKQLLKSGGFGTVSIRKCADGSKIAEKRAKNEHGEVKLQNEFAVQSRVLSRTGGVWHMNLCRLFGLYDDPIHAGKVLRMEYISGPDGAELVRLLHEALECDVINRSEAKEVWQFIAKRGASVVSFLTAAGCAHNDLTPQNFVIDRSGEPVFLDFGSATDLNETAESFTEAYAAPEFVKGFFGGVASTRSDVYSLGTLIKLSTDALIPEGVVEKAESSFSKGDFTSIAREEDRGKRPTANGLLLHDFLADAVQDLDVRARATLRKVIGGFNMSPESLLATVEELPASHGGDDGGEALQAPKRPLHSTDTRNTPRTDNGDNGQPLKKQRLQDEDTTGKKSESTTSSESFGVPSDLEDHIGADDDDLDGW